MLTTRRLGALTLGLGIATALAATPTSAIAATSTSSATVTATLTSGIGTRVIQTVTPAALNSVAGTSTLTGALTVTVAEAAVSGDATGWSVSAQLAGPFADTTTGTQTIPATALDDSANTVASVNGGGTTTGVAHPGSLDLARTIMSNTGQSASLIYTGTYTSTSTMTLTPPNGTSANTYRATLNITLTT